MDYTSNIRAGIKFLDEEIPADWKKIVDLDVLDMNDCAFCILGQIFGQYDRGLTSLDISTDKAISLGFSVAEECQPMNAFWRKYAHQTQTAVAASVAYADLTETWEDELHTRYPTVYGRR